MKKWLMLPLCLLLVATLALPVQADEGGDGGEGGGEGGGNTTCTTHTYNDGTVTTVATCVAAGVRTKTCTTCGATTTEAIPMISHTYGLGKELSVASCKEAGSVRYTCSACGYEKVETVAKLTTHTYDNACDADCNVCGTTRDAGHQSPGYWTKDGSGHYNVCTKCSQKFNVAAHYPGPAATEEKEQICLTCGYVLTQKKSHTHSFAEEYSMDDLGHWFACSGCSEQKDYQEHSVEGACGAQCSVCGYVRYNAHTYGGEYQTSPQGHWGICQICDEEGTPEAHMLDDAGVQCIVCGWLAENGIAEPDAHIHQGEWLYNDEKHMQECDCGEVFNEAPHTWDAGTQNEDGTTTYLCTDCGAERIEGEAKTQGGAPWMLIVAIALLAVAAGAGIVLAVTLKKKPAGKFSK